VATALVENPFTVIDLPMRTCVYKNLICLLHLHVCYSKLRHTRPGILSMANAGKDTNGKNLIVPERGF